MSRRSERGAIPVISVAAAAVSSAFLAWCALPPVEYAALAWLALVPLLYVLGRYADSPWSLFAGWLFAFIYSALCASFVNIVVTLPLAAYLVFSLYLSLFRLLFVWLVLYIRRRTAWPLALIAPPAWVLSELLQVEIPVLEIPLPILGYSQYEVLPLIQSASFTSFHGLSFLIVFCNSAIADLLLSLRARRGSGRAGTTALPSAAFILLIAIALPVAVYAWGQQQLANAPGQPPVLTAAIVQSNISHEVTWQRSERRNVLNAQRDLTLAASGAPDLVVWPESSIPDDLKRKAFFSNYVGEVARQRSAAMLVGSSTGQKGSASGGREREVFNSAFLISPDGRISGEYAKIKLLPFGESIPFGQDFPWPDWILPKKTMLTPGETPALLELPQGRFGVMICWENLFPRFFRQFVQQGAAFMVNITNESWFKESGAGHMFLSSAVFRAVENHVSLVRSASTGVSALIDPYGRIVERVEDEGRDLMVAGVVTAAVPAAGPPTFYTRHGDLFAGICVAAVLIMLLVVVKRRPNPALEQ